jgi:hypothetical protein
MCIYNAMQEGDQYGTVAVIFMCIGGSLLAASAVCGLIALTGIPKHGYRGILVRSIVGLAFSGAVLGYWIFLFTR